MASDREVPFSDLPVGSVFQWADRQGVMGATYRKIRTNKYRWGAPGTGTTAVVLPSQMGRRTVVVATPDGAAA